MNPPFPFPLENNLAMIDFVELHHDAAQYLEASYPNKTIYTGSKAANRRAAHPAFGYGTEKLALIRDVGPGLLHLESRESEGQPRCWSCIPEPGSRVGACAVAHDCWISAPLLSLRVSKMNADQVQEHFGLFQFNQQAQRGSGSKSTFFVFFGVVGGRCTVIWVAGLAGCWWRGTARGLLSS